jgi:hypothetical protein
VGYSIPSTIFLGSGRSSENQHERSGGIRGVEVSSMRRRGPEHGASDAPLDLRSVLRLLKEHYGPPAKPPTTDAFELVLLENVAYLATPSRRLEAFELLKRTVGTSPEAILAADSTALERVTASGILKDTFAGKLRECARIALEKYGGELESILGGAQAQAK